MTKQNSINNPQCTCNLMDSSNSTEPKLDDLSTATYPDSSDKQYVLRPQQRYTKRPKHPGMATFDGSLRKLPVQRHATGRRRSGDLSHRSLFLEAGLRGTPSDDPDSSPSTGDSSDARSQSKRHQSKRKRISGHEERGVRDRVDALEQLDEALMTDPIAKHYCADIQSSNESDTVADNNSAVSMDDPDSMSTVFIRELEDDAKLIYTQLVSSDKITEASTPWRPNLYVSADASTRRTLDVLHNGLVLRYYDFFEVTQSSDAPECLQRLALAFSLPLDRMWSHTYKLISYVCHMSQAYRNAILVQFDKLKVFLENTKAELDIAGINHKEWQAIEDNLHLFLHILLDGHPTEACVFQCDSMAISMRLKSWKRLESSSSSPFAQNLREWYFRQYPLQPTTPLANTEKLYRKLGVPLQAHVLFMMSGWLCLGPCIANSFHEFCKVFVFLAWRGITFKDEHTIRQSQN